MQSGKSGNQRGVTGIVTLLTAIVRCHLWTEVHDDIVVIFDQAAADVHKVIIDELFMN